MIDLDSELWEDIHDQIVAAERADEPDVPADLVERDLARRLRRRRRRG
ncbi:MAG TPA: hypothetical protein VNL91_02795 [Thermoanaerobaculia bacterium]|nr:hypothetical protein [Thermoanaerobaculia bacterium]